MSTLTLPAQINREVILATQAHFEYGSLQELVQHQTEPDVNEYLIQLKREKLDLLARLKSEFKGATDEEINRQLTVKTGEFYEYWQKLPGLVKEERKKIDLYSQLTDVTDLGWMLKINPFVKGAAVVSGGLTLYYLKHSKIIGAIHGIAAVALMVIVRDLQALDQGLKILIQARDLSLDKKKSSDEVIQKAMEAFGMMKSSSIFLRRILVTEEGEVETDKTSKLLRNLTEISQAIHKKLEVKGDLNPQQVKAFFKDLEGLTGIPKWSAYSWMIGGATFALYAYKQKAYLMVVAGVVHTVAAGKVGWALGTLQQVSYTIAESEESRVVAVFQEQTKKTFLFKVAANSKQIHAEVVRIDTLMKLIPSWRNK